MLLDDIGKHQTATAMTTQSLVWLTGGMFGIISVLGLMMASKAHDTVGYYGGLAIFVGAVLVIFFLIHRGSAAPEKH
jgi:uncharacterized membrane protein